MDYEELYQSLTPLEKELKDKLAAAGKNYKSVIKNSDKGDLKSLSKDLSAASSIIEDYGSIIKRYIQLTEGFNAAEYMQNGDFARQMVELCDKTGVDIKGEFPVYEVFPYKVKIDAENTEIQVDRRKTQCARPLYFVKSIKAARDRLTKASFNVSAFLSELAAAYDTACAAKAKKGKTVAEGSDLYLKDLYNFMVPMQRHRREYDAQNFAFDLARLYESDTELTNDGRAYQFGQSRAAGKQIRILDKDGNENFIGTIRFYTP